MDTWESFFRRKSERRSRYRSREALIKGGVLLLIVGSIVVAVYLKVIVGLPL